MGLDAKFGIVRDALYGKVGVFFEKIAQHYGYPENLGMPTISRVLQENGSGFGLQKRTTFFPPPQFPETWFEMIFGPAPKVDTLPRYIYETKEEGFYNFYIEDYRNTFFLPDWFSEFIQIKLNLCLQPLLLLELLKKKILKVSFSQNMI